MYLRRSNYFGWYSKEIAEEVGTTPKKQNLTSFIAKKNVLDPIFHAHVMEKIANK